MQPSDSRGEQEEFGEVISGDSQSAEVECRRLYGAPPFGSFVCIGAGGPGVLGVVSHASTAPYEGSRIVQAHGLAPGELEAHKPHLPDLLRTVFRVRLLGECYGDEVRVATPSQPPRLHSFVYAAGAAQIGAVTASTEFIRPLVRAPEADTEDLLVAVLRGALEAQPEARRIALAVLWGKYLFRLLRDDLVTLEGVMRRLEPMLPEIGPQAPPARTARPPEHPRFERPLPLVGGPPRGDDPFEEA